MKRNLVIIGALVVFASAGAFLTDWKGQVVTDHRTALELRGPERYVSVRAEVAATPEERRMGLMGRTTLPEGQGMLFVFDYEQPLSFWMKNTLIPLDILFFNDKRQLVSTTTMVPCGSEPCHSYSSGVPARYALEVPAGFIQEHGISSDVAWTLRGGGR